MVTQPLFYFPSSIAWVDDDTSILEVAKLTFGEQYPLHCFNRPQEALSFFEKYLPPLSKVPFVLASVEDEYYATMDHFPIDFNVLSVSQLVDLPKRNQEISVVIVDYNMPEMTGLEFCRSLKNLPMKKILLTGEVGEREAVAAFNDNIIDRFIHKGSQEMIAELKTHLSSLMRQYFCERTHALLSHLEVEAPTPLSDPLFIEFFQSWCQTHRITEYFIIDKIGSFLCFNERNERIYFVLHTENTLKALLDFCSSENELQPFLSPLENREKLPFFGLGREGWLVEAHEWPSHFYPATPLKGRELYYWAEVKENN